MNEMIERIARAMCRANITKPSLINCSPEGVEYHVNERWREWEFEARAAIEAMREPTKAMTDAVDRAEYEGGYIAAAYESIEWDKAWPVAIDEALK